MLLKKFLLVWALHDLPAVCVLQIPASLRAASSRLLRAPRATKPNGDQRGQAAADRMGQGAA